MKKILYIMLSLSVLNFLTNVSMAAEHPGEHPGKSIKTEHPGEVVEHPGEHPGEKEMLSADEIIEGIKDHINEVTEVNNGYYPLFDTKEGKDLRLKLVRVHEDKVSYIKKDDAYFACTDFITDGGTKYDVDFWMKRGKNGKLEVYQTKIHKKDGKPRFTYRDDEIVEIGPAMAP